MPPQSLRRNLHIPILVLISAVLLRWLWYGTFSADFMPYGDENGYYRRAQLLANWVLSFFGEVEGRARVDHLWASHRMPMTTILISPVFLFSDSISVVRAWLLLIENLVLLVCFWLILRRFGAAIAACFAAFNVIVPMVISFSAVLWSDLITGHLWLLVLLLADRAAHEDFEKKSMLVAIGSICGGMFLLRSNTALLGVSVFVFVAMTSWLKVPRAIFLKTIATNGLLLMLGFATFYGPWMVASSIKTQQLFFHPFQGFGKSKSLDLKIWTLSPRDEGWGYQRSVRYDAKIAEMIEEDGLDDESARERLLDQVLDNSSGYDRASAYFRNFKNLIRNENQYLAHGFWQAEEFPTTETGTDYVKRDYTYGGSMVPRLFEPQSAFGQLSLWYNSLIYYVALGAFALFCIVKSAPDVQRFKCAVGLSVSAFFMFVFFHPGHGRYVFVLLPTVFLGASLFLASFFQSSKALYAEAHVPSLAIRGIAMLAFLGFSFILATS